MASSKIRGVFGTGFASGSIASITLYAFYTYFGQRDELKNTVSASTAAQRRVEGKISAKSSNKMTIRNTYKHLTKRKSALL